MEVAFSFSGACASAMLKQWGVPWILGIVGFGKLSRIFSGSSDANAMMWAWRGGWEFFAVYFGWGRTAIGGGVAVTTVNSL